MTLVELDQWTLILSVRVVPLIQRHFFKNFVFLEI